MYPVNDHQPFLSQAPDVTTTSPGLGATNLTHPTETRRRPAAMDRSGSVIAVQGPIERRGRPGRTRGNKLAVRTGEVDGVRA